METLQDIMDRRIDQSSHNNVIQFNPKHKEEELWLCMDGGILKGIFATELEALRYSHNYQQAFLSVQKVEYGPLDLPNTNNKEYIN